MSVRGRVVLETAETFQHSEPETSYSGHFKAKKANITAGNAYIWNDYPEIANR